MGAARKIQIQGPTLYPKQHAAIFDPARFSVVEASTKAGKTLGCLIWQIDQCFSHVGEHWWIAPIYAQARIAYKRAKELLPSNIYRANDSRQELTLVNGTVWAFKGADNADSLYGEDVYSAVIDEASRCKEDTWEAIRSTLTATRGPCRVIGNVKGKKNWFYKLARRAQSGALNYGWHKLTAWDAVNGGVLAHEEIEQARADLAHKPGAFNQLYLAVAVDDGSNPFGHKAIERLVLAEGLWTPRPRDVVVFGLDLAKSVDWNVLIGLDKDGHVATFSRWQAPWKNTVTQVRTRVQDTPCLVDSTGVGDPVLEYLQDGGRENFEGFKFSSASKQQLMEGLALDVSNGGPEMPEGVLAQEMRDFEFTHTRTGVRYEAPTGLHDDAVCAVALARAKYRDLPNIQPWW